MLQPSRKKRFGDCNDDGQRNDLPVSRWYLEIASSSASEYAMSGALVDTGVSLSLTAAALPTGNFG